MTAEWERDCISAHGKVLTGNRQHYCDEWDWMPIDDTCPEMEACQCWMDHEAET